MTAPALFAHHPIEREHTLDGHPENSGRLAGTMRLLEETGTLDALTAVTVEPLERKRIERLHLPAYLNRVERLCAEGGGRLDPDTYAVPETFRAALYSAGAVVRLVEEVMAGRGRRGMSLMRPPGHHALADRAMGFCILSNVAIAALAARHDAGAERVLIVDWDVHHGNGTQDAFYDDPAVAFFSTHQHPFYPGTGALEETGVGAGEGFTVNVPLPPGVDDAGYGLAFDRVLAPFARRFRPDLILVSAGYDAHWRDPLAGESLSIAGYAALARRVIGLAEELCGGRLVLALEGGYDLEVLPHNVLETLRLLLEPEREPEDPFGPAPGAGTDVTDVVAGVVGLHGLGD